MINEYMKYVYIVISAVAVILLVLFFIQLIKTEHKVNDIKDKVDNIKTNVDSMKDKADYVDYVFDKTILKETLSSLFIIRSIKKQYRKNKNFKNKDLKKKTVNVIKKDIAKIRKELI